MRQEAWVTSAVEDKDVDKSLILAGSLRLVRTAKNLVVLTTLTVSEKLREKLKDAFDLVLLLEQKSPNGLSLEDYAKIQAFSLLAFNKCVYISPSALVLENCDEVFRKYTGFAVNYSSPNHGMDLSVYVYQPNHKICRDLGKIAHCIDETDGDFSKQFHAFMKNHVTMEKLDDKYNLRFDLSGATHHRWTLGASIVNFGDLYPLDLPDKNLKKMTAGERIAFERYRKIYDEDIKNRSHDLTLCFLKNQYMNEPIAVVGMSFRLPGGNNVDEFWSLLAEGRNAIIPVPPHRWNKDQTHIHCKNRNVEAGFLNVPIDEIDAKFFGLSPKEAEFLDPQQRLLLEVTWEALEDAMIDPMKLKGTQSGVFIGSWIHDYKEMLRHSVDQDFFRAYMGNSIASSSARISHFLETTGPSIATESGCSSAIAAVDMACKSLRYGVSSLAIAGGVNLLIEPYDSKMMEYVFSPDFRCKTFDADANGFARAEGCAVLVLKRLSDAMKDGDNIWGLVRGTALTQEGLSKSMGTPTVHSESLAIELALEDAGVEPHEVSYVEAHGTGTSVGDPLEIMAIRKAYSDSRTEPLVIGSVKTNVGHTESVSGITGIIKVLLSMKHEVIPKHLNFTTLNPNIDLKAIPAQIPLNPIAWLRKDGRRRIAGVSSFGISGTDGHAIIEEPPKIIRHQFQSEMERPLHIMKISAKSSESMDELLKKYLTVFNKKIESKDTDYTENDFPNLAYSANIGRATFNHRAVILARNYNEAAKILEEKSFMHSEVLSSGEKLCFLFTGQGSQYPGMAKKLYETSLVFKDNFDICERILKKRYNISIKSIVWIEDGSNEELNRTLYSQTSIFVVEYCLLKLWESWGVKPDYVMGHSLGEFAAAVAAGALDFEDALTLVAERSRLIDQLPRGKMLVIKSDKKTVDETISAFKKIHPNFWVDCAALNSSEQTVVAGDSAMIEQFSKHCAEKSLKTTVLAATHAFHSRHMDPMLDAYRKLATTVKIPKRRNGSAKYISGLEGKLMNIESIDAEYWVKHTREKVSYMQACQAIQEEGCTLFLEVGPHPVLSAMTILNMEGEKISCLPSIRRKENEWVTMLDTLSKLYLSGWKGEIDWKGFDMLFNRDRIKLPFYPFIRKPTWAKLEPVYAQVHPLLGSIMPTASNETVFQNSITLKNVSFVQDHVIGNTVIFPGAGFLEMCLAGGHSTVQGFTQHFIKPKRPIVLKSLKITSPLAIQDSSSCRLQTVISLDVKEDNDAELGYSVGVHRQEESDEGAGKWISHATAKFLPFSPSLTIDESKPVDISNIQSKWEKSDNRDFYEMLPEVGLNFGPKFQSLESGWKSKEGILASVKVPEDYSHYLIHPVIADAMIQAVMLWTSKEKIKTKLQVPVQIGEFTWLRESVSPVQFVYSSTDEKGSVSCTLVDQDGVPLAIMKGVDFAETTSKLVEGMIQQQSTALPKLWEETWKSNRGPMQGYFTHSTPPENQCYSEEDLKFFEEKNNPPASELSFVKNIETLTRFFILKALYSNGWKPEKSKKFTIESIMKDLKIKENFRQYIRFFLRSMAKEEHSILQIADLEENAFQFVGSPPTNEEIEIRLKCTTSPNDLTRDEYKLVMEVGNSLSNILTGNVDPLAVLFPENSGSKNQNKPSVADFYEACRAHVSTRPFFAKWLMHVKCAEQEFLKNHVASQDRPIYRVLEVGAGTGVCTKPFLDLAMPVFKDAINMEYCVTDVSPAFFGPAEKALEQYIKSIHFKKYDMEMDPLVQGLCPGYYDLITASEVFHVAKDIKKTMKRVRSLLKPGGLILIAETICPDEKITFIFGLLDGYWQFQDREFRKDHVTLNPRMWEETLLEAGFHGITITSLYNDVHGVISAYAAPVENQFLQDIHPPKRSWIIMSNYDDDEFTKALCQRISYVNRKCLIVSKSGLGEFTEKAVQDYFHSNLNVALEGMEAIEGVVYLWSLCPDTRDQSQVSLPFLTLMKLLSEFNVPPKVFAVVRGAHSMDSSNVIDPTPGTVIGFCKSVSNENLSMNVTCVDLDPMKNTCDQLDELVMNLWVEHNKQGVAFRDGQRLCPKLCAARIQHNESLLLPSGCNRFQLVLPKTRLISDLEFAYLEPYTISDNEVEVQVKAIALNFRDVFAVLKPIPLFENINTVGLDFSGVIVKVGRNVAKVKVGERVMGMIQSHNLSLPSHYKTRESSVIPIPDHLSFAEGVTLPAVFSTAVHCLISIAKMKKGETVLLHTASGGIGLAAIQICKRVGANIIATAGSMRKRTYLRNLGIEHVFHSRTTDFKNDIMKVTGGRGVDIVLNSITGPGFKEASLDVLSKKGRFIEMSKLNVWSKDDVKALRPDAFYEIVDLTSLESHQYVRLSKELRDYINSGSIKPIAYERFDALNIRGALNYLQKAKHIGKIVCIMPEVKLESSKLTVTTPLFNEESTYLVTGGLGGIGFEVVKWMIKNGAKHIAVVSRRSPRPEIAAQIEAWKKTGKHVQAYSVDVGDYEMCNKLLNELKKPEHGFPPLRGVMHAAGALQDSVLENQTWEKFSKTYNPKVCGSWNLHDLTKDYLLEHFVLFSSIAATFGSPGQTNHSAANAFEDSLAAYRRSNGLPALCVNWGNWGEVGVATEIDFPGVRPISTAQGLLALEQFLRTQTTQMTVFNVDSFALLQKLLPQVKHYVDDLRMMGEVKSSLIINSNDFWSEVDAASDREGKTNAFKKFIKTVIRNILKMDHDEIIDDNAELQTLGIDSLMMLEMKNGLQNILGERMTITASQLKDCNTTEMLTSTLVDILEGGRDSAKKQQSRQDLINLIREDSNLLPDAFTTENLKKTSIAEVKTVLLTGASGNLGPYLLNDMTQRPQLKKIYCLVRGTSKLSGVEKLKERLEELRLNTLVDMKKVGVIEGDITSHQFGLDEAVYLTLCKEIDVIIHCAVKSDHTAKYWKAPESNKSHVRTVNVLSTARLLEFAAEQKCKHFFHASTILALTGTGEDGQYSDGWQAVSAFDEVKIGSSGYAISKHISEQLVHHALMKGVPCKAFRFPYISGDSKTGRVNYQQNHFILRWLTCMKIGKIHDVPAPLTTMAVDHCAKISLDIFFNPDAPMDVYNVVQKSFALEQVLIDVALGIGVKLEVAPYDIFMEHLKSEDQKSPIAAFIDAYVEDEEEFISTFKNPLFLWLKKFYEDGANFMDTSKLARYAPDYEKMVESTIDVLLRDFTFLKKEGVFEKYGIQTCK